MSITRQKVVIVGDGASGKTCLFLVYANGEFPEEYVPTVFENYVAECYVNNKHLELALWDTAGQEEYARLRPLSYPHTNVILVAFSVDNPDSLANVPDVWIPEIKQHLPTTPIILVGLKNDLRNDEYVVNSLAQKGQKVVSKKEGEAMANKIGAAKYVECSAKENDGVKEVFEWAAMTALASGGSGDKKKKSCCICM